MNHSKKRSALRWIKDVSIKSLVILLVVSGGFYAYAQIAWPSSDPNPVTGVVGTFVGASSQVYGAPLNYVNANDYCETDADPNINGSHICTVNEMINSYNHSNVNSPILTYAATNTLWVNAGSSATNLNANDCGGWTEVSSSIANPQFGMVWNFNSDESYLVTCRANKAFACCK